MRTAFGSFPEILSSFVMPAGEPLADILSKAPASNSEVYDVNPYRFARLVDREGSIWIGDPGVFIAFLIVR